MKQILCFGDSNTWGLIPKTNQRYPWGVRWTSILDNELNRHFNNEYRVIEEGLCGRTTVFDDPLRDGQQFIQTPSNNIRVAQSSNRCDYNVRN